MRISKHPEAFSAMTTPILSPACSRPPVADYGCSLDHPIQKPLRWDTPSTLRQCGQK
jgi:hypothetical protein